MRSGFTAQKVPATHVSFAPDRSPAVLGDGTTSDTLRDNLRKRRQILDDIFQAAQRGDESETIRLAARLAGLRHRAEHFPKAA